ncbi:FAD binding domain-containing protein [Zychaea mexicana]|uniref:FAD binding domain-containing protein n=1 Tax=Zychaea mexicana TaxID=64656 RepID=UPI0022FE2693|nr:FAD binding domain-containing protein [Zychaea mexicana]KAI9475357.1 FAD binding domain-containing protein [Zychaea mexicana]
MFEVIVSGAGPVGSFFAYQMVSLGHSVLILDKTAGPTGQSRAILMTSRTLETLDNRGIAQHFLKHAVVMHGSQAFSQGHLVGYLDAVSENTMFPQMTCLPQTKTETVFADLLQQKSLTIQRETELQSYTQTPDYVEATIKKADGTTEVVKAKYIIGADGSHSAVRKCTEGWTYEGYAVSTRFAMADVVLEGQDAERFKNGRVSAFSHPKGSAAIIPLGPNVPNGPFYYRLMCNLEPYKLADKNARITHGLVQDTTVPLSEVEKVVSERIAPLKIIPTHPVWISLFRVNERKANGYRRHRAFLIGDAAHCHSPVGGQGMNLGLQDADNLAWKLSLVLKGLSSNPEALLNSYSAEREPIAEQVLKSTGGMTSVGFRNSKLLAFVLYYVMSAVMSFESMRTFIVSQMMQLTLQIPKDSPLLLVNANSKKAGLIEPGQYLHETALLRKRILTDYSSRLERRTLRDILHGCQDQHAIIFIGTRPSRRTYCPWTRDFWIKAKKTYSPKVARPIVIESTYHSRDSRIPDYVGIEEEPQAEYLKSVEDAFWLEDRWDVHDSVTKRVGLTAHMWDKPETPAAIVIVRPDMYVAHSSIITSSSDIDSALEVLCSYLPRSDSS